MQSRYKKRGFLFYISLLQQEKVAAKLTDEVSVKGTLDSTKAPKYLSLCKHREIYNGAFVLLRS